MANVGRATKDLLTEHIRSRVSTSRHLFVTRFKRLSPGMSGQLRRQLRGVNASCLVTKRNLLRRALEGSSFQAAGTWAEGPTAVILTEHDPVRASKILLDFIKDHEATLEVRGGIVEGQALSPADVAALARVPSREQLLAQFVTGCQAPIQNLVGALHGLLRQCVNVIDQIQKHKEGPPHD